MMFHIQFVSSQNLRSDMYFRDIKSTHHIKSEVFGMDQIDEAMAVLNRTASNDAVRAVLSHRHK